MSERPTAQLIAFPGLPPCAPAQVGSPVPLPVSLATRGQRHYTLADLALIFEWQGRCQRTIIQRLRALVDNEGLPVPLGQRLRNGHLCRGSQSVCAGSRWDAAHVDAWLHRPGPVAPASSAPASAPVAVHRIMSERARQLAGAA